LGIDSPVKILHISNMKGFWETHWASRSKVDFCTQNGLVRCEADWCWDVSEFKDFDLWIALDGRGELEIDGDLHTVAPGFSVCFQPGPRVVHGQHDADQPLQVFYCHFELVPTRGATLPSAFAPHPVTLPADPLLWSTIQELTALLDRGNRASLAQTLLWQLLLRLENADSIVESSPEERVRVLIRQIRESPATAYNVDGLARQAGLSAGHFRRIFRKLAGESPVQFILNQRIQRACFYLTETHLPIQRIATTVGYADVYFFSRQFKERMGQSPSAFRRRA
jgi:AraC-like DNA-binding protein